MENKAMEPVELDRVRREAVCIIIRAGLGVYDLRGPAENILEPESRVAWATVINDLGLEGYRLVTPEEYVAKTGMETGDIIDGINRKGSLFALTYGDLIVIPLPYKEKILPDIVV